MKRPDSEWFPTYFGWLYSYPGYPESLKYFKNHGCRKWAIWRKPQQTHRENNLQVKEWSLVLIGFTTHWMPLKFIHQGLGMLWPPAYETHGTNDPLIRASWMELHPQMNQHQHDMHVWNEFIEANPTRSQQWFHAIHTYTDLYFLRGASRPIFKDPSSVEKPGGSSCKNTGPCFDWFEISVSFGSWRWCQGFRA